MPISPVMAYNLRCVNEREYTIWQRICYLKEKYKLMSVFPVFADECMSVCYRPVGPQQL